MRKLKNKYKDIRQSIIKYIYTNRLFITYLIISICGTILVRNITINTGMSIKPLFVDIGLILLIGAFGYLVKPKNQYKYFFSCIILFTIIEVINSVYFKFYSSFASLSELSTLKQAETVTDSIFYQLRLVDFIYILQPIIFYYIHNNLRFSNYYYLISKIESKKKMVLWTIVGSLVFLGISFGTASGTDYSRLSKQWNRTYIVERFGILMYQFNDIFQTIKPKISNLFGYEDALKLFNEYFEDEDNLKYIKKNKYTGILDGYNIVYVHMESMQDFLMDMKFNGEVVAPNLKKLAGEGMFFDNFYSPISIGTSSDAEYMMLTGLLPSSSGTVFVTYSDNIFRTIPSILKERGYYTFSMHGNYPSMWNRANIHPRLGYSKMYFHDSYTFDEETEKVGLGINDKLFFKQAVGILEDIEKENNNYFGTVITLSNHSPFADNELFTYDINDYYKDSNGKQVSTCYLCEKDIGRYIRSAHYADEALGDFLKYIKESDKFNNTVFVFYGDHDAKISYKDMNYLYNYDYKTGNLKEESDPTYVEYDSYDHYLNKKVPLIIWTKNKNLNKKFTGKVSYTMAMYDVVPTLNNMLNIDNKYVLGHDIFNIKNNNVVVFPNGNYLTNDVYYNNSTGEYKILDNNKDIILAGDYIIKNAKYADKLLDVGNAIINYDLFNEKKKDE